MADELLNFYAWRNKHGYKYKPYCDSMADEYQRYCEEYRKTKYLESKGPEIDIATESNTSISYEDLVKIYGVKKVESINFKQHQECKLFRCLECWLLIHPDDEIKPFKEGFVHKLCSR